MLFGISADLGQIHNTSSPVAWALGVVRNPSIGYTSADNMTRDLSPYYVTCYPGTSMTQAVGVVVILRNTWVTNETT